MKDNIKPVSNIDEVATAVFKFCSQARKKIIVHVNWQNVSVHTFLKICGLQVKITVVKLQFSI